MNTRLQGYAAGVIEAAILIAVMTTPVIINYYGFRIFAMPKAAVLVSLGLLVACMAVIAAAEGGAAGLRGLWRRPLVAGALLTAVAVSLATAVSTQPHASLWGTGERGAGLVQALAALSLFAGAAWLGRAPERRDRIVAAILAASVPVSVYAMTQALQLEVVPGQVESVSRAFGTLSNPIFLAAYLMLLVPLTLHRIRHAAGEGRFPVFAGWSLVLLLQLAALVASNSRGPLLGLAAAGLVTLLALAMRPGRRWLGLSALGLMAAGLLFLFFFNQPGTPLAPLRTLPVIGRFGEISALTQDSSGARLRIWRSTHRTLAGEPARLLLGHGPESLKYALLPHGETYMAGYGQGNRLVDRAHNVLLDKLVMEGLLGGLALLLTLGAALHGAIVAAGLAASAAERRRLAALMAGGVLLGALSFFVGWPVPIVGEALSTFAGALTLLGMVAGLMLYLALGLLSAGDSERDAAAAAPPGIALPLLAVFTAAAVEASFGIQVVVTQMIFWVLAGLLLALALGPLPIGAQASRPQVQHRRRRRDADLEADGAATVTIGWTARSTGFGLALGALLSVLVYSLLLQGAPVLAHTHLVLALMLLAGLLAGLLAAADAGEGVLTTFIVAGLTLGLYLGIRTMTLAIEPDASLLWVSTLIWLLLLALLAGIWLREPLPDSPGWRGPAGLVYPILMVPAVALLVLAAVNPVRADIYFQSSAATFDAAMARDDSGLLLDAESLYERAAALAPQDDTYPLLFAERYTKLASLSAADLEAAATAFGRAQALIERAELIDPEMPFHKVNRGHLQLLFAQMLLGQQPEQAQAIAANAAIPLQEAFDMVPYDPAVASELATARWLEGKPEAALPILEFSRDQLDPQNPLTLRLLGQVYYELERLDEAQAAFEQAAAMHLSEQERLSILLAQGEIARERGQLPQAIGYYEQVLAAGGGDWSLLFNLGLMYRDNGDAAKARSAWTQALQFAPLDAQEQVQAALDSLGG